MWKKRMIVGILILATSAYGEATIGVDLRSRYVWRGTDYGNSASVQPTLEYSTDLFTVGAWGAWSVSGAPGGNENDLYLSTQVGPVGLTLTDYFFPGYMGTDDILEVDNHILEISASSAIGDLGALIAYNYSGDTDNSAYVELEYQFLTLGMGNGFYTLQDDPDFNIVHIGLSSSRDIYTISYILNPEQKTSFLVFGISL